MLKLEIYDNGKAYLTTDQKPDAYRALRFLVKNVERMEIRDQNQVTIYDFVDGGESK